MQTVERVKKDVPLLEHVTIHKDSAKTFADSITQSDFENNQLKLTTYDWSLQDTLTLLFYFNSMNYCFWAEKGRQKWIVQFENTQLGGSIALFRLLEEQARKDGKFLTPSHALAHTSDTFRNIFTSEVEIPLLESRFTNFIDTASKLNSLFGADIMELVGQCHWNAGELLEYIVRNFPSYKDEQTYKGITIPFLKRAQLQIKMMNDVLITFEKKGLQNLEYLTAFADYKVPQLLRALGILEYSEELALLVDSETLIEKDSPYELEIRIASISGVEMIKEALHERFPNVTAAHLDTLLWVKSQSSIEGIKPYHKTYTTAY